VILVALVAAGASYVVLSRRNHHMTSSVSPAANQRAQVLAGLNPDAPTPSAADVERALARLARATAFGGHLDGVVIDQQTDATLWSRGAAQLMPPASTVKLLTAVAALEALGPRTSLSTGVVQSGDTLYVVGGGDVTLTAAAQLGYPATATFAELARQTAAAVPSGSSVRVCTDTTAWSGPPRAPGWSTGYFTDGDIAPLSPLEVNEGLLAVHSTQRSTDPAAQARAAYVRALQAVHVRVVGKPCSGAAPPSGLGVASVNSPPVSALVERMLTNSDNDLAEALGRAVAIHAGDGADFAGEARAVTDALAGVGVGSGIQLYDASGLSRLDRVTPQALVDAVRLASDAGHPELQSILEGLPVAGFSGTLADRYRRGPASAGAGVVRAKTGTLVGVNTLAGYVVDAHGRLLTFAFMTDRAASPAATEAALDRLAAALAAL
jgi:D-alanyl-D-alanine carboxypeptidase/D-alanyl-D-alanine-endopeptidase (penicillin-binding protein 4)